MSKAKAKDLPAILAEMRDEMTATRFFRGDSMIDSLHAAQEALADLADVPDGERSARFACTLVFIDEDGRETTAHGTVAGHIGHAPQGEGGFGYDPLFWSTELHKGLGEATPEEKNEISHRGKAVSKLIAMWKKTANNRNGGKRQDKRGKKPQQEQQANGKAEQQNGKPKPEMKVQS